MSNDLMEILEHHFTRADQGLAELKIDIAELGCGIGRLEHGVAQLHVQLGDCFTGFDRLESGLDRIEQRLGMTTLPEPDPLAAG